MPLSLPSNDRSTARPHISHETYLFLRAERARLLAELDRVSAIADYWFERVTYTAAEISDMRAAGHRVAAQAYWDAGMPTDYPAELYPEMRETTNA